MIRMFAIIELYILQGGGIKHLPKTNYLYEDKMSFTLVAFSTANKWQRVSPTKYQIRTRAKYITNLFARDLQLATIIPANNLITISRAHMRFVCGCVYMYGNNHI